MKSMASKVGFHFLSLFMSCRRKFYFRHVLSLVPRFTPTALLNGSAFHLAKEVFYTTHSRSRALAAVEKFLKDERASFERPEDFALVRARLPLAVSSWIDVFGNRDLSNYKFLALEREFEVRFASGLIATVRPDAVVEDREKNVFILETKTTGFSADMTEVSVAFGDQATTQLAAVSPRFPRVMGVVPDILFWLKSSRLSRDIKCIRGSLVTRSSDDLEEWRLATEALVEEISARVEALSTHNPFELFQRNTEFCVSFNHPCDYIHICRERDLPRVPHGFILESSSITQTKKKKGKGKGKGK